MPHDKVSPVGDGDAEDLRELTDSMYCVILDDYKHIDPFDDGYHVDSGLDHFVRITNKEYGTAFSVFVRESRAKQFFGKKKKNVETMIEVFKLFSSGVRARALFHYHIVDDERYDQVRQETLEVD